MSASERKKLHEPGSMMWHNDGWDFMCNVCGAVVRRTRDNPFPNCPNARVESGGAPREEKT